MKAVEKLGSERLRSILILFLALGLVVWAFNTQVFNSEAEGNIITKVMNKGDKAAKYTAAKEIVDPAGFINLPAGKEEITINELVGKKVILLDFWTYSCINCIRTFPHLNAWHEKYKDYGLEIIGIHTPEFEFEKEQENVVEAVERHKIKYPVVLDNNYGTWNAYGNRYWPRKYLIDIDGYVIYDHVGEGGYAETERKIQEALAEAGQRVNQELAGLPDETPRTRNTPEIYLGSLRMLNFYPTRGIRNGAHTLKLFEEIPEDTFSLGGQWQVSDEFSSSGKNAVLQLNFSADKVFLVMSPTGNKPARVKVFLDGEEVSPEDRGKDVQGSEVLIDSERLYHLIDLKEGKGRHLLRLEFQTLETKIYAFTFG